MESLTFLYRGKEVTAKMEVIQKHLAGWEYHLQGKDGVRLFIFRKDGNEWSHVYGSLNKELREAILDALIMRFESDIITTFFHKGERQIVTVGFALGSGQWFVMINHFFIGSIAYDTYGKKFIWHIHNGGTWLLPRHMEKFIEMIKQGKIESPPELRSYILPLRHDS